MSTKCDATVPAAKYGQDAPRIIVEAAYVDPTTGAVYVHQDLVQTVKPFETEDHIGAIERTERFGDVASWAAYVKRFGGNSSFPPFLTWSESGLSAILDYHGRLEAPGRCQWKANQPFERSLQWKAWAALTDGRARGQKDVIEALEDLGADIVEPDAASLLTILRTLRATVNATAETDLRPDGSTSVAYTKDKTVQAGKVELPSEIVIGIPILKGHPVLYKLRIRVRVSIDDNARLAFRLSIPSAERALEDVFADRVQAAAELLGEDYPLLRASAWNG